MADNIFAFITAWYNLPFTVLLVLGICMAALQLVGLGGNDDGDSGANADADVDADVNADADLDADADTAFDHDMEHDLDHDADADGAESGENLSTAELLAFLGVGKAPVMVVLLILLDLVGVIGLGLNGVVHGVYRSYPGWMFAVVFPISLVGGGLISSRITRFIGKVMPPLVTTASAAQALVGMRGTVISPFVDQRYGQVHLRNQGGTLITVFAIVDTDEMIRRGDEVLLVSYNPKGKLYIVTKSKG